ncbi:MAG: MFS transporter [Thermoanaerobaculia bacterium]
MKERHHFAFILGFVGFVTSFGAHIVTVNLPVYAERVGMGLAMIGILIAIYDFAEIIAKPLFGFLADKTGMKRTMLLGIVFFTIASLLYLWINPHLLLLVRFLQGMGAAALSAVSLALIGVYYKENRGRAYGIYNAIKGAGYVVSPIIGGLLVVHSNFASIFIASAIIGGIAFLLSLALPDIKQEGVDLDDDDDISWKSLAGTFKDHTLLRWYAVIVVNMFFVGVLFGFLPVRIHDLGYSPLMTGILLSLTALSYLVVQPIAGRLADTANAVRTIQIGLLLSAISTILIPFVAGIALGITAIVAGIGIGIVWTNTDTIISRLSREGALGMTMGVAGSFKEFGDMVGPALIGFLSQAWGLTSGFVACGLLGLLSLGFIPGLHTSDRKKQSLQP